MRHLRQFGEKQLMGAQKRDREERRAFLGVHEDTPTPENDPAWGFFRESFESDVCAAYVMGLLRGASLAEGSMSYGEHVQALETVLRLDTHYTETVPLYKERALQATLKYLRGVGVRGTAWENMLAAFALYGKPVT